jgi:hypothetical protein
MFVLSAALLFDVCLAEDNSEFKDEKVRFSYSLGYRIGDDIKRRDVQAAHDPAGNAEHPGDPE